MTDNAAALARYSPETMLEGIRSWVEIESPSLNADLVNRMADKVEADARAAGARVERIPGRDGCGDHVFVQSPWGEPDEKGILVLSHYDTVHPEGTLGSVLPFRVEGDLAYGPGISDMKGGAYLAFAALRELIARGARTPLPIRHLYVSDEEIGSLTSRARIEEEAGRAKYVLVTEPARDGGRCVTARKGTARFDITIHGRAAHAGSRHVHGRSAIKEMARQILDLEDMTDYDSGLTVNVGVVHGGTRPNVVAYECKAEVDMRVPNPAVAEAAVARLMNLKTYNPDCTITVTGGLNRPPYEKLPGIAALYETARELASGYGFELGDVQTGGCSDGNFTASHAPTLDGLGVDGQGSSHSHSERLVVSTIPHRALLLERLMATLS
ncbi:M20 family metallopeptidase [Bosea sp. (in: a-proteobacteria)]|uniref:M20 family metallopeptidase n=1 Tax=Bosea sp. (in: a-proteobacteria) TaxID=1871050 RepID=UPI0026173875|nr:M20 family metallopeptidase [Bosea sp. (in: a-proteobacteria)]MCO5093137.1 M20 family metallopeptidase [Bosea sp. (in: a-proteobacteria)]